MDLVAVDDEGTWQGLLFDNPVVALPPALTWTMEIPFAGDAVTLTLDWLPIDAPAWQRMTGGEVDSPAFADPAEASVHRDVHHRYDRVRVRVTEQRDDRIRVRFSVSGDIDGFGADEISGEVWLTFTGIWVQLSGVTTAAAALDRLAAFTDPAGLAEVPDPRGISFHFR